MPKYGSAGVVVSFELINNIWVNTIVFNNTFNNIGQGKTLATTYLYGGMNIIGSYTGIGIYNFDNQPIQNIRISECRNFALIMMANVTCGYPNHQHFHSKYRDTPNYLWTPIL